MVLTFVDHCCAILKLDSLNGDCIGLVHILDCIIDRISERDRAFEYWRDRDADTIIFDWFGQGISGPHRHENGSE